jgi:UDP-glucose 4-epimerase
MKILVTGGAGFIGSNIVDKLINLGYETVVVDNLSSGKKENLNPGARFYELDIISPEVKRVFEQEGITHVIHHAAQIDVQQSIDNPLFDINNNILGTVNILENCKDYGVKKIIYASSAAVYGEPDYLPVDEEHPIKAMSSYGVSKHTPEHYLRMYKQLYELDYTILRYANAYGPRQDPKGEGGVIAIFVEKMLFGESPIIFGDGEQTRDFIYVEDIVKANLKALTQGDGELVNISCNTRHSVNDLYRMINQILNTDLKPIYRDERIGDIRHSYLDNNRARKVLNWEPEYDLRAGLTKTIEHYANIREAAPTREKE